MKRHPTERPITRKERKDLRILALFTDVYCRANHSGEKELMSPGEGRFEGVGLEKYRLCKECGDFLTYAFDRRIRCPLPEKPLCKDCHVHCYRPGHREKVREIMRFSGKYLIKRGRLDLLWHYFF